MQLQGLRFSWRHQKYCLLGCDSIKSGRWHQRFLKPAVSVLRVELFVLLYAILHGHVLEEYDLNVVYAL
jgi:hypothetical protein